MATTTAATFGHPAVHSRRAIVGFAATGTSSASSPAMSRA
jgi:hypothetical protein